MPEMKEYTAEDLLADLDFEGEERVEMLERFNSWLERGDYVAIYENHDLGHPMLGHKVFFPVGPSATIKEITDTSKSCPLDLGGVGLMSWRYYPHGTYSGPALVESPA